MTEKPTAALAVMGIAGGVLFAVATTQGILDIVQVGVPLAPVWASSRYNDVASPAGISTAVLLWIATGFLGLSLLAQAVWGSGYPSGGDDNEVVRQINKRVRPFRWLTAMVYLSVYVAVLTIIAIGTFNCPELVYAMGLIGACMALALSVHEGMNWTPKMSDDNEPKIVSENMPAIESFFFACAVAVTGGILIGFISSVYGALSTYELWTIIVTGIGLAIYLGVVALMTDKNNLANPNTREIVFVLAEVVLALCIHIPVFIDRR